MLFLVLLALLMLAMLVLLSVEYVVSDVAADKVVGILSARVLLLTLERPNTTAVVLAVTVAVLVIDKVGASSCCMYCCRCTCATYGQAHFFTSNRLIFWASSGHSTKTTIFFAIISSSTFL